MTTEKPAARPIDMLRIVHELAWQGANGPKNSQEGFLVNIAKRLDDYMAHFYAPRPVADPRPPLAPRLKPIPDGAAFAYLALPDIAKPGNTISWWLPAPPLTDEQLAALDALRSPPTPATWQAPAEILDRRDLVVRAIAELVGVAAAQAADALPVGLVDYVARRLLATYPTDA